MSIMQRPSWLRVGCEFWMPIVGMPQYAEGETFIWQQYREVLEVAGSKAIGRGYMILVRVLL